MAKGKAKKISYINVDFLDWSRYNINSTTELSQWVSSFGQKVNEHFGLNDEANGLTLNTPMGENIDITPGDIILRDGSNGSYYTMSAKAFASHYEVTEESGEPLQQ